MHKCLNRFTSAQIPDIADFIQKSKRYAFSCSDCKTISKYVAEQLHADIISKSSIIQNTTGNRPPIMSGLNNVTAQTFFTVQLQFTNRRFKQEISLIFMLTPDHLLLDKGIDAAPPGSDLGFSFYGVTLTPFFTPSYGCLMSCV